MPNIEPESGVVTHINVFTVPPDKQDELVESLIDTVNGGLYAQRFLSAAVEGVS